MPDPDTSRTSATSTAEHLLVPQIRKALHRVDDPEIRRPITDLGMVDEIEVDAEGRQVVSYGLAAQNRGHYTSFKR